MPDYKQEEEIKVPKFSEENGFYVTKQRSKMMSAIRAKNTKAEIVFRKELWKKGVRYRINYAKLPGKPDVAINKYKLVIFIDGEFWHGYNWAAKKERIKSNRDFWIPKIERNMQRDRQNNLKLEEMGYKVLRFWEKDIENGLATAIDAVLSYIH